MQVIINGESQTLHDNISISQLLKELHIEEKVVAIALNYDIVKKETWQEVFLQENDKLELLQFMSGG